MVPALPLSFAPRQKEGMSRGFCTILGRPLRWLNQKVNSLSLPRKSKEQIKAVVQAAQLKCDAQNQGTQTLFSLHKTKLYTDPVPGVFLKAAQPPAAGSSPTSPSASPGNKRGTKCFPLCAPAAAKGGRWTQSSTSMQQPQVPSCPAQTETGQRGQSVAIQD